MDAMELAAVTHSDPDGLAAMLAESPPSAGVLDAVSFEHLSAGGRLDVVVAWERLVRHAFAGLIGCL
ncbi:MAG TPA: hypothetical protein VGS97_09905, partial [Actinocrinis sp.]